MAKKEVAPGVKCRLISSALGPKGSSVGKIVRVVCRSDPPTHVVWGPYWDIVSVDGTPFKVKITSPDMQTSHIRESMNASAAQDWLEPIDDDEDLPKAKAEEHELVD
jgi:hypothetical protein